MKKYKNFDCVQMKWDIQQKLAKEFVGISDEEFNRIQMERVTRNPILGAFLNKVRISKRRNYKELILIRV